MATRYIIYMFHFCLVISHRYADINVRRKLWAYFCIFLYCYESFKIWAYFLLYHILQVLRHQDINRAIHKNSASSRFSIIPLNVDYYPDFVTVVEIVIKPFIIRLFIVKEIKLSYFWFHINELNWYILVDSYFLGKIALLKWRRIKYSETLSYY